MKIAAYWFLALAAVVAAATAYTVTNRWFFIEIEDDSEAVVYKIDRWTGAMTLVIEGKSYEVMTPEATRAFNRALTAPE